MKDKTINKIIVGFMITMLMLSFSLAYTNGAIKQELIFEKSGKEVGWFKAGQYPDAYFTDANVTVKQ